MFGTLDHHLSFTSRSCSFEAVINTQDYGKSCKSIREPRSVRPGIMLHGSILPAALGLLLVSTIWCGSYHRPELPRVKSHERSWNLLHTRALITSPSVSPLHLRGAGADGQDGSDSGGEDAEPNFDFRDDSDTQTQEAKAAWAETRYGPDE
jgi:hypothetical protein